MYNGRPVFIKERVLKATVIADSISSVTGKRITTFELEFPRIILAEFNTHNALSKNASSSRAIPVPTMLKQVRENPAFPARFGAANTGMQDNGLHDGLIEIYNDYLGDVEAYGAEDAWRMAGQMAAELAESFHNAGYAKQICNRLIEPFQMMKVVMTATELNNFFWLRDHSAADPTIAVLARLIKEAFDASTPVVLLPGEWHVPYYNSGYWKPYITSEVEPYIDVDAFGHSLEHALVISASCCAQVSYRKLDDTIEKARGVVARLNLQGEEPDQPVHASPLEHQATPISESDRLFHMESVPSEFDAYAPRFRVGKTNIFGRPDTWQEGITHMDRDGTLCSGNLKGFIQHRQLVPNHVKAG